MNLIDQVSSKLSGGFKEIIDAISIISHKTVELEKKNEELMNRINTLENQYQKQQKGIDLL